MYYFDYLVPNHYILIIVDCVSILIYGLVT